MRIAFLSSIAILTVACNSSVTTGGTGGDGGSSSTTTTSASSTSTGGDPCPAPPGVIAFVAGGGETCFEPLTEGQTVKVLQGPQGGYHIWLAVGCVGCQAKTTIEFGVKDPATKDWYATTSPQKVAVDLGGAGWQQQAGFTAFLPGVVWDETTTLPKGTHVLLTTIHYAPDGISQEEVQHDVVLGDVEQYSPPCEEDVTKCGLPGGLPCCALSG